MKKFSIIIPVYNPNHLLFKKCLESIKSQAFNQYEVIIVDDGSTNGCERIYNEYKDFKSFKIENSGVSYARNYGILKSCGDWIIFVDADDTLPIDTLKIYNRYTSKDYDLILGKTMIIRDKISNPSYSKYNQNKIVSSKEVIDSILLTRDKYDVSFSYIGAVWGKCYRKEVINNNNVFFTKNIAIGEDTLFNIDYIINIDKIYYIDSIVYNYVINSKSAMNRYSRKVYDSSLILKNKLSIYSDKININSLSFFNVRQLLNIFELYLFHTQNNSINKVYFYNAISIYANDLKKIKIFKVKKEYVLLIINLKFFKSFYFTKIYFKLLNIVRKVIKNEKNIILS